MHSMHSTGSQTAQGQADSPQQLQSYQQQHQQQQLQHHGPQSLTVQPGGAPHQAQHAQHDGIQQQLGQQQHPSLSISESQSSAAPHIQHANSHHNGSQHEWLQQQQWRQQQQQQPLRIQHEAAALHQQQQAEADWLHQQLAASLSDRALERELAEASSEGFEAKVEPSCLAGKEVGNAYSGEHAATEL